jgi:hypothetical protein
MSVTLHFGVLDIGYSDASGGQATTTGKVAGILEKNYKVMGTFFQLRREKIAGYLADSMADSIGRLVTTGKPIDPRATLTYGADQKIEAAFREFLYQDEMSKLYFAFAKAPLSAAAAAGVNHRKKMPYSKKNKPRPFAIDTGLYVSSFRAWTTGDIASAQSATAP